MNFRLWFYLFVVATAQLPALADPTDLASLQARVAKGDAEAELDLGRMYHLGRGVSKDFAKAAELYRKSADQGNAKAMYNLGYLYSRAEGMPQDDATAYQWFQKSADAGLPVGQLEMGKIYFSGDRGLPQNYDAAKKWLTLAAQQANAPIQAAVAADLLGTVYENGLGVPVDGGQAVSWYTKGAELGYAKAQSDLGLFYMKGAPFKREPAQSYKWLKLAASQGDLIALHLMPDYLHGKAFTNAEIAEGERLIDEYQQKRHQSPLGPIAYPLVPTLHPDVHAAAPAPGPGAPATPASPQVSAPPSTAAVPANSTTQN